MLFYSFIKQFLDLVRIPKVSNFVLCVLYRLLFANGTLKYNGKNTSILIRNNSKMGNNLTIGDYSIITALGGGSIKIEDNVVLARNVLISSDFGGHIYIGKGTIIGPNTVFRTANHLSNIDGYSSDEYLSKDIFIGNNCWIGSNCVILPGTSIPDDCVVGALSVLNKSYDNARLIANSIAEIKR